MSIYNVTGLEKSSVPSYITPEMYGAAGDGTTDDYNAIAAAITAAGTNGQPLYFAADKEYYCSQALVVAEPNFDIIMDGEILSGASTVALTIGDPSTSFFFRKLLLNVSRAESAEFATSSIGIKIINADNSDITIGRLGGFGIGLQLNGNSKGFAYNRINLNYIRDNITAVNLKCDNNGWTNENQFYGGRLWCGSSFAYKSSSVGILMSSSDNEHLINNNSFFCPCMEGLNVGVNIDYGTLNYIINARTEGTTTPLICSDDSRMNYMSIGYGNNPSDIGLNAWTNGEVLFKSSLRFTVFDTGFLPACGASNEDGASTAKTFRLYQGAFYKEINSASVNKDYVSLQPGARMGCLLNTEREKIFSLMPVLTGNTSYRIVVYQMDENGDPITNDPPIGFGTTFTLSSLTAIPNSFINGVNTNDNEIVIKLADSCVKAYIAIYAYQSECRITRLQVKSMGITNYITDGNEDYPVLSAIPTNTGFKGQFVKNANPTASALGWVYNGTEWIAV